MDWNDMKCGERNMQIKDLVNQTIEYVEQYYHRHKRETIKPKIWDLILTIRYLSHEVNATQELLGRVRQQYDNHRLDCFTCGGRSSILTKNYKLYCPKHAFDAGYCPICGNVLDKDDYCKICKHVVGYDPDPYGLDW